MKRSREIVMAPLVILALVILACGKGQATPTPEPLTGETPGTSAESPVAPTPIVHLVQPGDPPDGWDSEITDRDSSVFASERRANGGENFNVNQFERPFNARTMDVYYPELDILLARLAHDNQWVYATISLQNTGSGGSLGGNYGIEFDLNVDGRGEVLVMAAAPGAGWSTDGVQVWQDLNHDVGAAHPVQSDAPAGGDGYETRIFDAGSGSDPDLAWARISPLDPKSVQIALKRSAIETDGAYTWNAWADRGVFVPAWYDYSDHFTLDEAGSPLVEQAQYYPLKALFELDNTCRWAVGFTPTGSEPGICPVVIDCSRYTTQTDCNAQPVCIWSPVDGVHTLALYACKNK